MVWENSLPATSLILCWISKTDNINHLPLRDLPRDGFFSIPTIQTIIRSRAENKVREMIPERDELMEIVPK